MSLYIQVDRYQYFGVHAVPILRGTGVKMEAGNSSETLRTVYRRIRHTKPPTTAGSCSIRAMKSQDNITVVAIKIIEPTIKSIKSNAQAHTLFS